MDSRQLSLAAGASVGQSTAIGLFAGCQWEQHTRWGGTQLSSPRDIRIPTAGGATPAAHGRWHVLDGRSGHVLRPHVHAHETDGGLAAPTTASEISGESRVASVGNRGRLGASETRNVGDASHTYGVGTGPPLGPAHGAARHRTTGRTPTAGVSCLFPAGKCIEYDLNKVTVYVVNKYIYVVVISKYIDVAK